MTRRWEGGKLVVATHNPGKLREIAELLAPYGVAAVSAGELGLPEPEETEDSFIGNARLKAAAAAKASGLPALADDSGLSVAALEGAPGIYSARWAGPSKDFGLAMARVWSELEARKASEPRRGAFHCALALVWPDGHEEIFEGIVEGDLVWPARGERGFGYDPMFLPDGESETYGEMEPARKHASSHRARAFRQLVAACFEVKPIMASSRRLISSGSPFEAQMGYSRAVVQGDWAFVSGTTGYNADRSMPESAADQARNALAVIGKALAEAGFGFEHVVRATYIITDAAYAAEITPELGAVFGEIRPAATMVVAGLIKPEMKVEIEVTAYKG